MAKKVVAKTNISFGKKDGETVEFAPGDEVNVSELGMTKAQLEQLYDAGAIELQETADAREESADEDKEKEEAPLAEEPVSTPPATPAKSTTPTKATASEAKSGGKGNAA